MFTLTKFLGLNNQSPEERMKPAELVEANNCYVSDGQQVRMREGYSIAISGVHKNVFDASAYTLATKGAGGDLVAIDRNTYVETTVYTALGHTRVWYVELPDGRVAFSNGAVSRITNGLTTTQWGVPVPASVGTGSNVSGLLDHGEYRWRITYVRTADNLEGGPAYSGLINLASGGLHLASLPALTGYSINVYLTTKDGATAYLAATVAAGTTTVDITTVKNKDLTKRCRTDFCQPAPATGARLAAFWRGRALVAVGPVLYASRSHQWELFDYARDVRQLPKNITLVQPVDGGIFVGTENELAFLEGTEFDKLVYRKAVSGSVVLGSGVAVPGEHVKRGDGVASGVCMLCIAGKCVTAGYSDGAAAQLTEGRYQTEATEVSATFRRVNTDRLYLAAVQ